MVRSRLATCQGIHRTSPWIALCRSGSSSAASPARPTNVYRPSSRRLGHGANTWPRPEFERSRLAGTRRGPRRRARHRSEASRRPRRPRRDRPELDLELLARGRREDPLPRHVTPWRQRRPRRGIAPDNARGPGPVEDLPSVIRSLTARSRLAISVRWVNACGMFPISCLCSWSYSSEKSPRSFRSASSRSNSASPRCAGRSLPDRSRARNCKPGTPPRPAAVRRPRSRPGCSASRTRPSRVLAGWPRPCRSTRGSSGGRKPT